MLGVIFINQTIKLCLEMATLHVVLKRTIYGNLIIKLLKDSNKNLQLVRI